MYDMSWPTVFIIYHQLYLKYYTAHPSYEIEVIFFPPGAWYREYTLLIAHSVYVIQCHKAGNLQPSSYLIDLTLNNWSQPLYKDMILPKPVTTHIYFIFPQA